MIGGTYLAYPIDQRGPAHMVSLFEQIERIKRRLIDDGIAAWVFDPGDAFKVSGVPQDDSVARINRHALVASSLCVAFLPAGVPTVGVPMEIDRARAQGKHVLVFSDTDSYMLHMTGIARVGGFDDEDVDEAFKWLATLEPPKQERYSEPLLVKVHEGLDGSFVPQRAYDDDAGLDLVVSEDTAVAPGAFSDVPCGISVELPPSTWGLVTGRSSALRKRGLLVHSGVIDAGYRGPLFAGAFNLTDKAVRLRKGERVAQLIVINNYTRHVDPVKVDDLTPSARGTKGFGSTG